MDAGIVFKVLFIKPPVVNISVGILRLLWKSSSLGQKIPSHLLRWWQRKWQCMSMTWLVSYLH